MLLTKPRNDINITFSLTTTMLKCKECWGVYFNFLSYNVKTRCVNNLKHISITYVTYTLLA